MEVLVTTPPPDVGGRFEAHAGDLLRYLRRRVGPDAAENLLHERSGSSRARWPRSTPTTTAPDATAADAEVLVASGRATVAYGFDCGDPRFGGDPNGPDNDVSEYRLTDNLGTGTGGSCAPVADGVGVMSFGTGPDLDPAGRASVRVDVPSQDTVWKLAVAVTVR